MRFMYSHLSESETALDFSEFLHDVLPPSRKNATLAIDELNNFKFD